MEFNEYWEENKVKAGLLLRKKCDVEAGWYAALEYGAPNSIHNKQRESCAHEWVLIEGNPVVTGMDICVKCHSLKAHDTHL